MIGYFALNPVLHKRGFKVKIPSIKAMKISRNKRLKKARIFNFPKRLF